MFIFIPDDCCGRYPHDYRCPYYKGKGEKGEFRPTAGIGAYYAPPA